MSSQRGVAISSSSPSADLLELTSNFAGQNPSQDGLSSSKEFFVETIEQECHQAELWSPRILKRRSVWSFIVVFAILAAAVIVLWNTSTRMDGLVSVSLEHFYLWTYGPTAVFTIVSALWGQVEYRTLQLQPWRLMSKGYVPASQGLLLDYLSDWNVWALLKSLKRRHFMVAVAVSISLLLKLLTAFSTGLFTTVLIQVSQDIDLRLSTSFGASSFNSSAVDATSYMQSWGVKNQGLKNPIGTVLDDNGYHAFQVFYNDAQEGQGFAVSPNHTYLATVDILTPDIYCVEAKAITNATSRAVTLQADECKVDVPPYELELKFVYLDLLLASCNGELENAAEWRLWTYVAVDSDSQQGQPVMSFNKTMYVNFVALMCSPSYATSHGNVTWSGTSEATQPDVKVERGTESTISALNAVQPSDLLFAAYQSVDLAQKSFHYKRTEYLYLDTDATSFMNLHNIDLLNSTATDWTKSYMVQIANNYLAHDTSERTPGTMTVLETRLALRDLSVWVVVSVLAIVTVLSLVLNLLYLPCAVCPRDPGTIAGLATILAGSPDLKTSLSQTGSATNEELENLLKSASFSCTDGGSDFRIKQRGRALDAQDIVVSTLRWWRPFSTTWWSRSMITLTPIILLIILEFVYRDSKGHQGIADILLGDTINAASVYVPALVFLAVRTLFESVYFAARIFQPYHNLKRGHASPSTSVLSDRHRSLAVVGVWNSLRYGQWPVLAAGIAILVGPILPIVVSGLYTIDNIASSTAVTLNQLNRVNMTEGNFVDRGGQIQATWVGDLILEFNASYPKWTHGQWSFPKVVADNNSTNLIKGKSTNTTLQLLDDSLISTRLPALHVDLPCTLIPSDQYQVAIQDVYESQQIGLNFTQLVDRDPLECGYGPGTVFTASVPVAGGYFNIWQNPLFATTSGRYSDFPGDCPPIIAAYGRTSSDGSSIEQATVLQCRPQLLQTDINVHLKASTYDFDLGFPPTPVSNSTKVLYDGYMLWNPPGYNASLQQMVPIGFSTFFIAMNTSDETSSLDGFFRSMVLGLNGTGSEALLDPTVLQNSLRNNMGVLMAQVLGAAGHEDYTLNETAVSVTDRPAYTATLTYPYRKRLVQNEVSTRILQAVLLVMCVSGVVSMVLMDTKKVLPKNPMSIAGLASLLVDSKMATRSDSMLGGMVPVGGHEDRVRLDEIFQGKTYSMRWVAQGSKNIRETEAEVDGWSSKKSLNDVELFGQGDEEMMLRKRMFCIDAD